MTDSLWNITSMKAKFSNGDQVTAYDVKQSFDLLVSEAATLNIESTGPMWIQQWW